jgi:hypothetical protein
MFTWRSISKTNRAELGLIYLAGLLYLLYLGSYIREDVFYSADGGLKFIVVRQINAGEGFQYLRIRQPGWVREIWTQGFFPLKPPFVYDTVKGYLISFSPAFQLLTAGLFKIFGFRGLYLIPFFSILLLWLGFLRLMLKNRISPQIVMAGLCVLIFCSPLTVYGVIYWEHMPAVLLLFAGVAFIMDPEKGPLGAAWLGLLAGLACWLRPEAIIVEFALAVSVWLGSRYRNQSSSWWFTAGLLAPMLVFFLFNRVVYESWLGPHSRQVFEDEHSFDVTKSGFYKLAKINLSLITTFCFTLLLGPLTYVRLIYRKRIDQRFDIFLVTVIGFCLLTPFFLPNAGGSQWGPRYFLPIIPIILVLLVIAATQWVNIVSEKYKPWLLVFMVIAVTFSFYENTIRGGLALSRDHYQKLEPAVDFVKANGEENLVINSYYTAMELGSLFRERNFFLAEENDRLEKLFSLFQQNGVRHFLYIYSLNSVPPPEQVVRFFSAYHTRLDKVGPYYIGMVHLN